MKSIKTAILYIALSLTPLISHADTEYDGDAQDLFSPYLEDIFPLTGSSKNNCTYYLNNHWDAFGGDTYSYATKEKEMQNGATFAGICAVNHGFVIYELLGKLKEYVRNGTVKKYGVKEAAGMVFKDWSEDKADQKKYNDFTSASDAVSCLASTPRIHVNGNYYNQVVNATCTSYLGMVDFDLKNNSVHINGKGYWNSNGDHYGRNLQQILNTKVASSDNSDVENTDKPKKKKKK